MFEFISLLDYDDHKWFINTLSQEWKDGYQTWTTLVQTTGRTDLTTMELDPKSAPTTIDFLNKEKGLRQVQHDHDDTFISEDHRLLRKVDLPDPILDEVKRVRSDGQVETIRLVNSFSDVTFTIDKDANKRNWKVTQEYGAYSITISPEDDKTQEKTLLRTIDLPVRFQAPYWPNYFRDSYLY